MARVETDRTGQAGGGTPEAAPFLRIEGLTKSFGTYNAVDGVSLDIRRGEFFALLGGSGCGKTTLLRMLAGFETPSAGRILLDGVDITDAPPFERPVNLMFQSYALFPHMSVEDNVEYGLKREGMPRAARKARVRDMLELVQLGAFRARRPHQLSGGQRQRVALARALAKQPKLLLLDEPLGALDKKLREQTQFELANIQKTVGTTFVVVTHDQDEAMSLSDRVAVMERGAVRQIGTPHEIYEFPRSAFVADFIGSINMFEAVARRRAEGVVFEVAAFGLTLALPAPGGLADGQGVRVAIRPEKLTLARARPAGSAHALEAEVVAHGYLGRDSLYRLRADGGAELTVSCRNAHRSGGEGRGVEAGARVFAVFEPSAPIVLAD